MNLLFTKAYAAGIAVNCDFLNCNLNQILGPDGLIDRILRWFVLIAVPLTSIAIVVAGGYLIFYSGSSSKREEAKKMLITAIWGLVFVLASLVIVKTIMDFFVVAPYNPL